MDERVINIKFPSLPRREQDQTDHSINQYCHASKTNLTRLPGTLSSDFISVIVNLMEVIPFDNSSRCRNPVRISTSLRSCGGHHASAVRILSSSRVL